MTLFTPHEKIKTKIVAFLFNTRADVLRDEMYRALCLHVLVEADQPCDLGQVTELVAYAISSKAQVNASLQAIVADELTTLVKRGNVNFVDGTYRLNTEDSQVLPSSEEEEELVEIIKKEIRKLAREVKPNITYAEIESLQEFYFEVCELVAKAQIAYLAKDQLELDYISNYELTGLVTQLRIKFEVDKMIDGDKFIERCFLKPPDTLSNYVYLLIKVNIILQLLAWDPELAYLQDKILKNKTLYLDTSVLFPLMLESNPMHEFVLSLLTASVEELGVKLKVQDITIDEYESVIREIDQEFSREHQHLRQIVKICNENNEDPVQFLESGIFIDYLKHHSKHIDLGSWQRYKNNIDRNALISKLKKLNVQFDRDNAYVPYKDYNLIQSNMIRASVDQVKRGKRTQKKSDVTHDVQMYYLIKKNRNRASNEFSLGYDTYLLTMDGSLAHFAKYEGFTWIDTYFIFPNQWYELAFPFLRMKITHNSNLSSVFANNAFSQIFPTLESLIPLKVLGYVFDMGGENLSLGSIQALVEGMFEKRLVERLDPANKDLREREEAQLSVQRMIAEFVVEDQKIVEGLQLKAQELEKQKETLQNQIDEQEEKRKHLEENVSLKEGELVAIDQQFLARQNVDDIYSDAQQLRKKIGNEYQQEIEALNQQHNAEVNVLRESLAKKDTALTEMKGTMTNINSTLQANTKMLQKIEREKEALKDSKQRQAQRLRKITIIGLMLLGLLVLLLIQLLLSSGLGYIIVSVSFLVIGIVLYQGDQTWGAFITYGIGLFISVGTIWTIKEFNAVLWIIPMLWEIIIYGTDRLFVRETS